MTTAETGQKNQAHYNAFMARREAKRQCALEKKKYYRVHKQSDYVKLNVPNHKVSNVYTFTDYVLSTVGSFVSKMSYSQALTWARQARSLGFTCSDITEHLVLHLSDEAVNSILGKLK